MCTHNAHVVLVVFVVVMVVTPVLAQIQYSDFNSAPQLQLVGSAQLAGGRLRLTSSAHNQAGAGWHQEKLSVGSGFETVFSYQLSHLPGDGLAFVVQNSSVSALGHSGGAMGYSHAYDAMDGIPNSLAVEIDTFDNSQDCSDGPTPHISIQTRGTEQNFQSHADSLGYTGSLTLINNTAVHTVKISYEPGTMRVYVDGMITPVLTAPVDLAGILNLDNGAAWVGFTAGTGSYASTQEILS